MKHIDIICPKCGGHAIFIEVGAASLTRDAKPYFQKSRNFETIRVFENGYKPFAIYFFGLGDALETINDWPEGYSSKNFSSRNFWPTGRPHAGRKYRGSVICNDCGIRRKHILNWPQDAHFAIDYKGQILWAPDRKDALNLLNLVEAEIRPTPRDSFLAHIPAHFLSAKARPHVSKKLRTTLGLPVEEISKL